MNEEPVVRQTPQYHVVVKEPPNFDFSIYMSNYTGRTVFRRLYLIASCSLALREEAARLAVAEAEKHEDVQNYQDAVALLQSVSGADQSYDPGWVDKREKKNAAETKRLENELKQYKNNLIRESIRMGNEDLGGHYHSIGELGNAMKAYSRMRDYCTTPIHIASTALRVISVAIEQKNWVAAQSQVAKIRSLQMKQEDAIRVSPKTMAVSGLSHMCLGEFKDAAAYFLDIDPALGDTYSDVLTSNDVAVYGSLCALASMSRGELTTKVLENDSFRNFLELEPHFRRAIGYFSTRKFSRCLEILESHRADYLLDIYLQDQLPALYHQIRTKSIVQYFEPFSKVTLDSMEQMFGASPFAGEATGPTAFQDEIVRLIESGRLSARIDLENGTLVANEKHPRAALQQTALKSTAAFVREARLKLLRINALNAGLIVKAAEKSKKEVGASQGLDINSLVDANDLPANYPGGHSLLGATERF